MAKRSKSRTKCPKGTRLLKRPVKEGGKTRYCTKPRKSPKKSRRKSATKSRRRKCPEGTRLLKRPVKEGSKTRYCTKPRKPAKRSKTLRVFYSDYDPETSKYTYKRKAGGNVAKKVEAVIKASMKGYGEWDDKSIQVVHVKDNVYKVYGDIPKGQELRNLARMGDSSEFTAKTRSFFW